MLRSGLTLLILLAGTAPAFAQTNKTEQSGKAEAAAAAATAPVESTAAQFSEPIIEETEKQVPHSRILPVKVKPIQEGADGVSKAAPNIESTAEEADSDTLALYTTQGDGSLGSELWAGMKREEVIAGLSALPVPAFSPVQRDLALRLLLTRAPVAASNDKSASGGLFSARLAKLIELGAFREAMQLNEKLESQADSETAALAGMQAFLGGNQVAIACLEQKALPAALKTDKTFWPQLDKFCQTYIRTDSDSGDVTQSLMHASLAYMQTEKLSAPARFEDISSRSLIELLVLSKSGTLDRGSWSPAAAAKLTPSAIAFLLAMEPAQKAQKLSLLTIAVAHGQKTPADLASAYQDGGTAGGDWKALLGGASKLGLDSDRDAAVLKDMLSKADALTPYAYAPFADAIAAVTPAAPLTSDQGRFVLDILLAAQHELPVTWVNFAYGSSYEAEESGESALLKIWSQTPENADKENKKPAPVRKGKVGPDIAKSLVLQDFLSKSSPVGSGQNYTYDKLLSLTGSTNYVMPSDELTESLKKVSGTRHLAKAIMYSLQVLDGRKADQVHPAVLFQVLKALKTAGLSEETASLAHEALAGLTKEKKEN